MYSVVSETDSAKLCSEDLYHKGRFGCWTCTVVRQDKAVEHMISEGNVALKPLFDFRNWLAVIRDNKMYRHNKRRNGSSGLGPFTLEARKEILNRLIDVQSNTEWEIIRDEEIEYIKKQWRADKNL